MKQKYLRSKQTAEEDRQRMEVAKEERKKHICEEETEKINETRSSGKN